MRAKATWHVNNIPEDLSDVYISFGLGDEQWEALGLEDDGARLSIKRIRGKGYRITLRVPIHASDMHAIQERPEEVWISPNVWEGMSPEEENRITFSIR